MSPPGHCERVNSHLAGRQWHTALSSQWAVSVSGCDTSKLKDLRAQTQPSGSPFSAKTTSDTSDRVSFISLGS